MSSPFSIHESLLGSKKLEDSLAPTKILRHVLHAAANDRVKAELDIEIGYSIVKTAREACDEADNKITELDQLQKNLTVDNDEDAWKLFDAFAEGIINIEAALLDQQGIFATSHTKLKQDTVTDGLTAVSDWSSRRDKLKTQLENLQTALRKLQNGNSAVDKAESGQQRDDAKLLNDLVTLIKGVGKTPLDDHDLMPDAVETLVDGLDTLYGQRPPNNGIVHAISGAWITYAAILERKEGKDSDRKDYLGTEPVWKAVEDFAKIIKLLDDSKFSDAYTTLSNVLQIFQGNATPPDKRYFEIVKASTRVVPPYVRRIRTLIKYTRELIKAYNDQKNKPTRVTNNAKVLKALKEVLDAAGEVAKVQDPSQSWTRDATLTTAAVQAVSKAQTSLKAALQAYDTTKAGALDTEMTAAETNDNGGMASLQAKWEAQPATRPNDNGPKIKVTLKGGKQEKVVDAFASDPVNGLIWSENQEDQAAHFSGATMPDATGAEVLVSINAKLSELAGTATTLTLTLVKGKSGNAAGTTTT